ncbi:hypothetical protein N182_13620 [Sinorhizobium sp. GL2]|nr:hypothetical protein N182_13620 [Sinorhizobium sp. GL2]
MPKMKITRSIIIDVVDEIIVHLPPTNDPRWVTVKIEPAT